MQTHPFKIGLCVLAITMALTACNKGNQQQQMPPLPVTIQTTKSESVPVNFEFVGQTAGFKEVEVRAKVSGTLLRKYYQEGQPVSAGAPLFQIDPAPFQASLDQANASLGMSQATLNQSKADLSKVAPLYKVEAVSKKEYDDARAAVQSAEASVKSAQALVKQAQINLSYTNVSAPISGATSKENVSEGSYITATGLLTKISQLDPMYVNFTLSETEAQNIRNMMSSDKLTVDGTTGSGQGLQSFKVKLKLNDGSIAEETGEVNFTDSVIDPTTGSIQARAIFNSTNAKILPGQFVRVILEGGARPNVIAIPQVAVMSNQQGKMVWVQGKDGKVEPRIVQVGDESGKNVIIESGLKAGDKVVVDNLMKIRPGTTVVHMTPEEQAKAAQKQASAGKSK